MDRAILWSCFSIVLEWFNWDWSMVISIETADLRNFGDKTQ
jgi:hypothetical protein